MLKLLIPRRTGIFGIASGVLTAYFQKITGEKLPVTCRDDGKSDLIILGSDAENAFVHELIVRKALPDLGIRTNCDDYRLFSLRQGKRKLLVIAGGRPRALLYGVYRFLEEAAGCRWFWDGDVVPRRKSLSVTGFDLLERPRFDYRGLRYFAHRSLDRFQAEHWDFDEWKQEIDWIVKKKLNTFMLRLGLEDLFQRAFPETVSYPGWHLPEAKPRSYDDRTPFWPLKYRGELHRKVIAYARERDLIHPEDVGTMTHWYSRTPYEFLEKVKPSFIPQVTTAYREETGLVWDIRDDRNLDNYFKLTQAHIRDNGEPGMFHTIGLAERRCYQDKAANHEMKLYAYRRIIAKLRERYPDTPLLLGSWDFIMYWSDEEVKSLIAELDPRNTLVFDYTSDIRDEEHNFTRWGLKGKFPWTFGIFHTFEPGSDIRGAYDTIEKRLPKAAADPMCRGFFFWPECSHSDTLMLEYVAANAWDPGNCRIGEFLPRYCRDRYGKQAEKMLPLWQKALPLVKLAFWTGPQDKRKHLNTFGDCFFKSLDGVIALNPKLLAAYRDRDRVWSPEMPGVPELLRDLAELAATKMEGFLFRDLADLGKMCISRFLNFAMVRLGLELEAWRLKKLPAARPLGLLKQIGEFAKLAARFAAVSPDFSMYDSLERLKAKHRTNPDFETTLKANGENNYCRSFVCEFFPMIYLPQFEVMTKFVTEKIAAKDRREWTHPRELFDGERKRIQDEFYATPLKNFAPDHEKARRDLPEVLKKLARAAEQTLIQEDMNGNVE